MVRSAPFRQEIFSGSLFYPTRIETMELLENMENRKIRTIQCTYREVRCWSSLFVPRGCAAQNM